MFSNTNLFIAHNLQKRLLIFKPSKNVDSYEQYIITKVEIPAQAKTLANIYYFHHNKNIEQAIESLKKLDIISDYEHNILLVQAIRKIKENKKVHKIIKYAYLYLIQKKMEEQ